MDKVIVSWQGLWRVVAVGALVWVVAKTWQLWLLVFIAFTLAAAMLPAARWGERRKVPRSVTVLAIYVGLVLLFTLAGSLLVPMLIDQGAQLARQLPALFENARRWVEGLVHWVQALPIPQLPLSAPELKGTWQALLENTLRASAGAVGALIGLLLIFFLAAYFVIDADRIGRGLLALVPSSRRAEIVEVAGPVINRVGGYARGQLLVSVAVGIVIATGLAIIGVPYSVVIGTVAALLNVVPFIGSFIAFLLALVTALNVSLAVAVWTVLLFAASNLLEGKVLMPYFLGRTTGLHPVAVLVVLLVGAHLAGLIGAIVSVPLLAGVNAIIEARAAAAHR